MERKCKIRSLFHSERETHHSAERPNVCGSIPGRFHDDFWAAPRRCSHRNAICGILGICRVCASQIAELDIREPDLAFSVIHEDIVEFHIVMGINKGLDRGLERNIYRYVHNSPREEPSVLQESVWKHVVVLFGSLGA